MRHLRTFGVICISLFFGLLMTVASTRAAEGGDSANSGVTELFKWINFAILAGLVLWVFGKVLPPTFRGRAQTISSAISKSTAAKVEADRQLREAEDRLAKLEQEVAQLREEAKRDGVAEADRIRKASQSDAERIAIAAQVEIEAAERSARLELKAIAAKLAVDGAENLLAQQLTPKAQESLVAAFVKSLDGRPN